MLIKKANTNHLVRDIKKAKRSLNRVYKNRIGLLFCMSRLGLFFRPNFGWSLFCPKPRLAIEN